ncbi:MAG TPA: anaerobic ribonucleoside-triphosphate reductase activating protein [Syntrophorhabdaceae bacterium]|nr:anaerobic ribonucleoside-triphosphate reductase activating protein [Syntrophorhabdaceae bacterium]
MSLKAEKVPIKGFIETSFIDWKGHLSSVIFTGGCNFRCPYCHNSDLVLRPNELEDIPLDYIIKRLKKFKKWVNHIVITGGEPTIHKGLLELIEEIKSLGFNIKLDTNGSNPEMLKELAKRDLLDYIAMDIKGPLDRYSRWCGIEVDVEKIKESLRFILEGSIDYEFRMTVVPFFHKKKDVYETVKYIKTAKRFYIQEFKPRNTLNPSFMTIEPFSPDKIKEIKENVKRLFVLKDAVGVI